MSSLHYLALLFNITFIHAITHPIRHTNYGQVKGIYYKKVNFNAEIFLGIPYAEPPIGPLRFQMPNPPERWTAVRDARTQPYWCVQFWYPNVSVKKRIQNEDCLYLNVLVPSEEDSEEKNNKSYPVLVWIHGGSYQVGGMGSIPIEGLVNAFVSKGVVVVLFNYRLGPLGYMSLMSKECPGNFGLGDQFLALKWVRNNIAYFQGDPNSITLLGESAGGASISLLAISPQAEGLFHRAIMRSASSLAPWALRSRNTDLNSHSLLESVGCSPDGPAAMNCMRSNVTVQDLKKAWSVLAFDDLEAITKPNHKPKHYNHPFFAHTYFTPVVDGYMMSKSLIPKYPETAITERAHVPLLIGTTTAESMGYITWVVVGDDYGSIEDRIEFVVPDNLYRNPEQVKEAVFSEYFKKPGDGSPPTLNQILVEVASDQTFMAPVMKEADIYRSRGVPTYVYRFHHWNKQHMHNRFQSYGVEDLFGAPHGLDLVYLLKAPSMLGGASGSDTTGFEFDDIDDDIANSMAKSLHNFIKFGNPNHPSASKVASWPPYSVCDSVHIITANNSVNVNRLALERDKTRTSFWSSVVPVIDALTMRAGYEFTSPAIECINKNNNKNSDNNTNLKKTSDDTRNTGNKQGNFPSAEPVVCTDCFYKHGFFIALVCAIVLFLSTCALAFLHCSVKSQHHL